MYVIYIKNHIHHLLNDSKMLIFTYNSGVVFYSHLHFHFLFYMA